MNPRVVIPALCAVMFVSGVAAADGAGGAFWGSQVLTYPGIAEENLPFDSTGDQMMYTGGMGYGIDRAGNVTGGFGVGYTDPDNPDSFNAGFGGLIRGKRLMKRPVNIIALLYFGVGGVSGGASAPENLQDGVFAVMGELTVEASVPLMFFHPTFYAGYQVISSVGEGNLGEAFLAYTPTVGFRMLFGGQ